MRIDQLSKYIFYLLEIIKGRITNSHIPIFVTICVTNRCNLKCLYCYEEYYDRNYKEFSTEQLLNLIDECASMGTRYISINGGEAFLRKDIGIIIDKIKEKNLLCHLSTNGVFVKSNIPILKKIDSLAISIDGLKESNDLNRGSGTFDKIIEGIESLNKNNIKFHVHTVLTRNNRNAVDEILALAQKYNFSAQISMLRTEDSPDKKIGLDDNELRSIIAKILEYKKMGLPIFFSYYAYKNMLNWPFSYNKQMIYNELPEGFKPKSCYIKRFSCHIEANGLVYPCIMLVNKFKAHNFLEAGFKKAWQNLANNPCQACYNICCNDHSAIFNLAPNSLWNAFKIVINRISKKNK